MVLVLFNDYVLIKGKLFHYKEVYNNDVCNLCYFNSKSITDSCCYAYRSYIGVNYYDCPYCYALGIEESNRNKISNRIPMIAIIKPFPYKLSLFVHKFITKNESKFKIYEI